MFNTIKSKILLIVCSTFVVLISVLSIFSFISFKNSEQLIIRSYFYSIAVLVQNLNKEIIKIENNAKDMALLGNLFYTCGKDKSVAGHAIINIFDNYTYSLGGGIWFEPYIVDKNKRLSCIYAYRNKQGKVVIDEEFESESYDYLNQGWYEQIKSKISKQKNIAWSLPYYEKQGSNTLMVTGGSGIYDGDKLIGISTVDLEISSIMDFISKIKPTQNSFVLFADRKNDYILVSTDKYLDNAKLTGASLTNIPWYSDDLNKTRYFKYHNLIYVPYVKVLDNDMILIVNVPANELFGMLIFHSAGLLAVLLLFSICLSLLLYLGLKNNVLKPINKLTDFANKISEGNTNIKIKIEKPLEFAHLANTFDKMTNDIKLITKKQSKIDAELSLARSIQASSLPNIFPPFPDVEQFDIFASMTPAKEVGGDFYDFYFISPEDFMFIIADVSGKGIPAALFMMTTKTLISNIAQTKCPPKEMIEKINHQICENNKEGFFVTLFAGIVNINTGAMTCINCGHNPPLLKRRNGQYEYLNLNANMVLGVVDNIEYELYETTLEKDDKIFLYTDGITEAVNEKDEMYGEQRLPECLNQITHDDVLSYVVNKVKSDVINFSANREQSDDLTMLIFDYKGKSPERVFKSLAIKQCYKPFYTWLHSLCDEWNLSDELSNKLDMCAEEIYANVTFYAYPEKKGTIETRISRDKDSLTVKFIDEGLEYNPLEKDDPDITLPPEERQPGGLGIFMVKQMTSGIAYERTDGQNILTLKFAL